MLRLFGFLVLVGLLICSHAAAQQTERFSTPASTTFTVPANVFELTVQAWGAGGCGGSRTSAGRSGGGGGGAYARDTFSVNPGQTINLVVGGGTNCNTPGGDSWFMSTGDLLARGGRTAGNNSTTGANGGAAGGGNISNFGGGRGANAPANASGGGGSSAGAGSGGVNAVGQAGAGAPAGGGDGGNGGALIIGGIFGQDGAPGDQPGGGGGGATLGFFGGGGQGGNGGDGLVVITYEEVDVPPAEIRAEWRMDEAEWDGTSGEIEDSSGNGNDATARTGGSDDSYPDTAPAQVCRGGRFRGQGFNPSDPPPFYVDAQHFATAPDSPGLSPLDDIGAMSLGGWFRLGSVGGTLIHKGEGSASQEYRVFVDGNQLKLTLWNRFGSPSTMTISNQALQVDTWYFFAATVFQLPGGNSVRVNGYLYDDSGQLGSTNQQTLTVDYTSKDTSGRFFFGGVSYGGTPTDYIDGILDEIRVYGGVLEPAEIDSFWSNDRPCPEFTDLLLEYRFEESSFDGTNGEVADSSGNGFNATSSGGVDSSVDDPAIGGNPGTCRYSEYDGNDDFVVDSDAASYLEGLDSITVMAWVYNTAALAGNDGGIFFTGNTTGNRDNRLGLRYDTSGTFGGGNNLIKASVFTDDCVAADECHQVETASNVIVRNDWQHVAMTWVQGEDIRVFVDGSELAIVATEGPGANGVIDEIDRLEIGQGAKGDRWQGRIDEFRIFDGALSQPEIVNEMNAAFPCDLGYDHIRLTHPPTGLTCSAATITVEACADPDCDELYSGPVDVDFTSPSDNWTPDPVTFDGSESVSLLFTTPGFVTLDAQALDPSAANPTRCFLANGSESNCEMEFLESGFVIEIPDHVSDSLVSGTIAAVESDPTDPEQCVPGFDNETKDVEFWSGYVDPDSGSLAVQIDGGTIPGSSPGAVRSLDFDGNGEASFSVRYPDVGNVEVNARYQGSGDDAGLTMLGSGRFIARPDRFALAIAGNAEATGPGGDVFTSAGTEFDIEVASLNASGNVTPNFGQESSPEDVALEQALVAPVSGIAPALNGGFPSFGTDCDGNASPPGTACGAFSWPEVGIISLTPRLASGAYLGTADVVGTPVDHVGRFIPHHFQLSNPQLIDRAAIGCGSSPFTYVGERFDATFTVHALSASGSPTQNYRGGFAFLDDSELNLSEASGPTLQVDSRSLDTWEAGSANAGAQLSIARNAPIPPEGNYRVVANPVDDDNVALQNPPGEIGTTELRFGRIVIDNAIGSELGPLDLRWRAEYWDGNTWLVNDIDDCTALDLAANVDLTSSVGDSVDGTAQVSLGGGTTQIDDTESELTLNAGLGSIHFTAPGTSGWVEVLLDLEGAWPFLRDDLDDDGSFQDDPRARASFGLFDGNSQRIYIREISPQ